MSNIIKSSNYVPIEQMRMLEAVRRERERLEEEIVEAVEHTEESLLREDTQLEEMRRTIMEDAKQFGETQIRLASEEAELKLKEAEAQIEAWWNERRVEDVQLREELQRNAYDDGYQQGMSQAEEEIQAAYESTIAEGASVLQQAYHAKEQILQEAEPFVVTVSCAVAEKIIDRQLTLDSDLVLELVRKQLSRKRESGRITLCVSPQNFAFVHAAREELSIAIDSQAELLVIPDASVKDHGCVIRSSLGSIDARINTQLEELKKALQHIATQQEEQSTHEV